MEGSSNLPDFSLYPPVPGIGATFSVDEVVAQAPQGLLTVEAENGTGMLVQDDISSSDSELDDIAPPEDTVCRVEM